MRHGHCSVIQQHSAVAEDADHVFLGGGQRRRCLSDRRHADIDFSFFLYGSFGQTINNAFRVGNSTLQTRYNNLNVNYWTPAKS